MDERTGYMDSGKKLPFYMMFPFSDHIRMEEEAETDAALLKSLYPAKARRIWPLVEDVCDRLEYDGSIMFDEYPDKNLVRRQVLRIQERVGNVTSGIKDEDENRRLKDLIEMLLYQEMYRRRQRRARFQRHFIY